MNGQLPPYHNTRNLPALAGRGSQSAAARPWWKRSKCLADTPEQVAERDRMFFPDNDDAGQAPAAKAMCRACPVRWECLAATLDEESLTARPRFGIRGGLSPAARQYAAAGVLPGYHERRDVIEAVVALDLPITKDVRANKSNAFVHSRQTGT